MEDLSIYDLLAGSFTSIDPDPSNVPEDYFDRLDSGEKLRRSIVENLKKVLQTRRGSVKHLPDFGVPDIRQIYFEEKTVKSVPVLLKETIQKYEPRLEDVRVREREFDEKTLTITLEVAARIKGDRGKEILLTEFSSTGWTKVVFERDQHESSK